MKNDLVVKAALFCISVGQIVVAALSMASGKGGIGAASRLYGADFGAHPQFAYIIRPMGVYMAAVSLMQFAAIREPRRNKRVIDATLALFAVRQAQRWYFRKHIALTFGIAVERHDRSSLFFLFWGLALLAGRLVMKDDPEAPI